MNTQPITKPYAAWLGAAVFFLSTGLFLFFEEIAVMGSDIFRLLDFTALVSVSAVLLLLAGGALYKSGTSRTLKRKYNWINGAFLLAGLAITFLLEAHTRTSVNLLAHEYFVDPLDLTMPLLLLAAACTFMAKKHSELD